MKNSVRYQIWQKDLIYLENLYNLKREIPGNLQLGLLSQIKKATGTIPKEIIMVLGKKTGKSLVHFLRNAAGTIIELQNLLSMSLSLNLITISEYHVLSKSLIELGEVLKALNHTVRLKSDKTSLAADENKSTGYWVLN
jgi:four helix bundle protein